MSEAHGTPGDAGRSNPNLTHQLKLAMTPGYIGEYSPGPDSDLMTLVPRESQFSVGLPEGRIVRFPRQDGRRELGCIKNQLGVDVMSSFFDAELGPLTHKSHFSG